MAEWLGTGLQNPLREFESPRRLKNLIRCLRFFHYLLLLSVPTGSGRKEVQAVLFDVVV